MEEGEPPKEFPDVSQKLAAPKKLSAFEKERLAAEEKRKREQEETAAALREFEDSFGQDGGDDDFDGFPSSARGPPAGTRGYGASRGGFGGPARSGPGSLGPPPSLKRKRALDELREQQEVRREQEAFEVTYSASRDPRRTERKQYQEDEEAEDTAPRPTVQLSSLPPGTTEQDVKLLLLNHLPVHSVTLQHASNALRESVTAIAALEYETATSKIDSAVSALREKYLGHGFFISISRHLSSTALQPGAIAGPISNVEPFGAEKINRDQPRGYGSMRNAPPPSEFAPPDAYDAPRRRAGPQAYATLAVQPPLEIGTVRTIHVLVDRLLSESDPGRALEIEAALMATPAVGMDERFSFLYDAQSPAGVYYRYLLWSDEDGFELLQEQKRNARGPERIHDDVVIDWNIAQGEVPFMDLTRLGDVLDHPNYESSEEDSDDEVEARKFNTGRREGEGFHSAEKKHLTPLQLAKFTWMLSRMPSSQARLRIGDVASITSFAIKNAGAGAEEIVGLLTLNVEKPFNRTQCAKFSDEEPDVDDGDAYEPGEELPSIEAPAIDTKRDADGDSSQVKLVALYLINDVLHNSSTAGVRNAWKYRQLFETAFRRYKTFKKLGGLSKELGWGRMKEEQWRNKIRVLFEIWEQNSVFATDIFQELKRDFFEQPVEEPSQPAAVDQKERPDSSQDVKKLAKFKRIDGAPSPAASASPAPATVSAMPVKVDSPPADELHGAPKDGLDGVPMDDLDGAPMPGLDGAPMEVDGASASDSQVPTTTPMDIEQTAVAQKPVEKSSSSGFSLKASFVAKPAAAEPTRKKQAEDMFADSDED